MTNNDDFLSVPQVAARLGISSEGVRRRISKGELRAVKLGPANSAVRVANSDLCSYLESHVVTHS